MWNFGNFGDRDAIIDETFGILSYTKLKEETEKLTNAAGERFLVFVLCSNTVGSVLGYSAFMNAHIVPLMLNRNIDSAMFKYLINAYYPKYLWLPDEQTGKFEKVHEALGYSLVLNATKITKFILTSHYFSQHQGALEVLNLYARAI